MVGPHPPRMLYLLQEEEDDDDNDGTYANASVLSTQHEVATSTDSISTNILLGPPTVIPPWPSCRGSPAAARMPRSLCNSCGFERFDEGVEGGTGA